jgi:hypothetical protein
MDVEEDENVKERWWHSSEKEKSTRFTGKEDEFPVFAARFGLLLSSHFICNTAIYVAEIGEESLTEALRHADKNVKLSR